MFVRSDALQPGEFIKSKIIQDDWTCTSGWVTYGAENFKIFRLKKKFFANSIISWDITCIVPGFIKLRRKWTCPKKYSEFRIYWKIELNKLSEKFARFATLVLFRLKMHFRDHTSKNRFLNTLCYFVVDNTFLFHLV